MTNTTLLESARTQHRGHLAVVGLDALTGVWNREGFTAAAQPMFDSCQRREAPMALACFEFHSGEPSAAALLHGRSDRALVAMADLMVKTFRKSDIIGRVGEQRFAVLLSDCTDEALAAVEGIRDVTGTAGRSDGLVLTVGMVRADPLSTLDGLLRDAVARVDEIRRGSGQG